MQRLSGWRLGRTMGRACVWYVMRPGGHTTPAPARAVMGKLFVADPRLALRLRLGRFTHSRTDPSVMPSRTGGCTAGLADPEPFMQPHKRLRRPPIEPAHHMHEGGDEQHTNQRRIGKDGQRQPDPKHSHE